MKDLFSPRTFSDFGPHALAVGSGGLAPGVVRGPQAGRLRAQVRGLCPRQPGVYGMVDANGVLIYVGKAKNLRARLLSYFRPHSRDPKAGRIVENTRALAWELAPGEFAALLRELELIRRWRPRFNVAGQPGRRRHVYVCLGRRPAPHVFLSTRPPSTALALFGSVPAGVRAREAVRRVNDWFRLKDCPQAQEMVFADQRELFPVVRAAGCIRHEIGNCLGPCAAACTREEYAVNVRAVRGFLEGRDRTPLEMLAREMTAASDAQAFERAACLRDRLEILTWICDQLEWLRRESQPSFVYPVTGFDGTVTWYLIHRGRVKAHLPLPRDDAGRRRAREILETVYRPAEGVRGSLTIEEIDGVLLVASWFRRYPAERARTMSWEHAVRAWLS